jgi:precorrin-4/cobalt-precorrin-4 C11-methyltransferase
VTSGKVYFVGAGPGAPDLLTLRATRAMAESDIVIWGRSLLMEEGVRAHSRPDAEIIAWPPATMADLLDAYDRAHDAGLVVTRLKSGDPTLFGEMAEELTAAVERGLDVEIIPGVSSPAATAAAFSRELVPGPVVVARDTDDLPAATGAGGAVAVLLSAASAKGIQESLIAAGLPLDAACAVGHRVSWPDEALLECRLEELSDRLVALGLRGPAVLLLRSRPAAM